MFHFQLLTFSTEQQPNFSNNNYNNNRDKQPKKMSPKIKITYFDFPGRAEATRLALTIGGIEFEDFRMKREDWPTIKPTTPYGSVPVLNVDGRDMAQSNAMLRYAGKLSGIYPEDPLDAFFVDEVIETMVDCMTALMSYRGPDKEKLKEAREQFSKETLPRYMGALVKRIDAFSKNGPFVLGDKVSIADLSILQVYNTFNSGYFEYIDSKALDPYDRIKVIKDAVLELPEVKKYYGSKQ